MRKLLYLIPALLITLVVGSAASSNNGKLRLPTAEPEQSAARLVKPKSNSVRTNKGAAATPGSVNATSDGETQVGAPLTISAAVDISGSVLNSRQGRDAVEALRQSIPGALQPGDQFQLLLFYGEDALTTVAPGAWGEGAASALSSLLKLRIRPGDRTRYSVVLNQLSKLDPKNTLAVIVTDGVISTGSPRGDEEERGRTLVAAAGFIGRGGQVVLVPVVTGQNPGGSAEWLARALQARKISTSELRAGALRSALFDARAAVRDAASTVTVEPEKTQGSTRIGRALLILILTLVSALVALLWMRRRKRRAQPTAPQAPKEDLPPLKLKISWAHADDEEFTASIVEARETVTIGGAEADTIRHEGLRPGHVKLNFSNDETRLEAHGPLRLDGGIRLEPNGKPVTEVFPAGEEVAFSAGKMTYLIERLPPDREGK